MNSLASGPTGGAGIFTRLADDDPHKGLSDIAPLGRLAAPDEWRLQ
ncbi:hypothetical protein NRF20_41940 [Streptomyces sp. R-74717]